MLYNPTCLSYHSFQLTTSNEDRFSLSPFAIFVYFNNHDYLPNLTADTCFPEKKMFKNRF